MLVPVHALPQHPLLGCPLPLCSLAGLPSSPGACLLLNLSLPRLPLPLPPLPLQPEEGRILDSASAALAEVREARRANRADLRAEMERWARQLHSQGVSERPQVVVRRDRLCIPVRAGRQGELPKGSVSLAISSTGNTLYMEPQVGAGSG